MKYVMPCLCLIAAAISLNLLSGADESARRSDSVAAESLLPESAFAAFRIDGSAPHESGLKETAAWKALEESGLIPRAIDVVQALASAGGEEAGQLVRDTIDHVRAHGFSAAAAISAGGDQVTPYGVVVMHDAAEIADRIRPWMQKVVESERAEVIEREVKGRTLSCIAIQGTPAEVCWWNEGTHLVVAVGIQAAEQVIATAEGKNKSITSNPLWNQLRKSKDWTVDSFAWLSPGVLMDQFGGTELPPTPAGNTITVGEFAELLGLHNIRQMTFQSGYSGLETWVESRIDADGELTGLASLLKQDRLEFSELPPLPKNTTGFTAASFDAGKAWDTGIETFRNIMEVVEPAELDDFDRALGELNQHVGMNVRDDLIAAFGDVWCVYADPAALPIPIGFSPAAAVSVRDKEAIVRGLDLLAQIVRAESRDQITIRKTSKDGRESYSIASAGMPLVPTIMVSDKWLVLALTPGSAQSFASREAGKLPSWKPDGQVAEALKEMPAEFTSLTVSDPAPIYQQILLFAPMAMAQLEAEVLPRMGITLPFGVEDIPAADVVTEPMFPNVTMTWVSETGLVTRSRQSVPGNPIGGAYSAAAVPVAVALLLPAVQQAREAARRTQSSNNLKMMGLALHNYHDVYRSLPRGTVENEDLDPEERLSWFVEILPYVEQAALYNSVDKSVGWKAEENALALQTAVTMFYNPSQPGAREYPSSGDYVGIAGIGPDAAMLPLVSDKAGMFGYDRKTSFRDVTDGLSNTLMVTDASSPGTSYLAGGPSSIRGFSQKPYINGPDGIGSPHQGGMQALLGDGSVRFISENIDENVLEALATIHGGEVIGEF